VAEAGASIKSVGPWELHVGTYIEWGTRWQTRFGAGLGRLSFGRSYLRKWPFMVRRYAGMAGGACIGLTTLHCAEFSRSSCFVCLLGTMPRYPRSDYVDPNWSHSHVITASIRLALTTRHCNTATHTARDSNLDSGNHDMSRLSALAYPNDVLIYGLTDKLLRLLSTDIGCGTLASRSRSRRGTATHAARNSNLGSGNHDMTRLSALAYPNDVLIHGLTDKLLRLISTDIGCGTLASRSRRGTATHTARNPHLASTNHDMSRLSALAYPNDAPIYGLADIYTSAPALNGYWVCLPRPSLSPRHGNTRCSRLKPRQW
jgi:hypothetical protein